MVELWTLDHAVNVTMIADPSASGNQHPSLDAHSPTLGGNRERAPMPTLAAGYSASNSIYGGSTVSETL